MKDSKLVEILMTISADEFKKLEKFAASPYFATGRDLSSFLKVLKSFHPDFSHKNFNADYVYSKVYPQKVNSGKAEQTLKTLSSDLTKICKQFFKQLEFENDVNRGNYYLNNQLRVRKLYKDFAREYKNSVEQQKNSDKGGVVDFIEKYFLNAVFRDYSLDIDDFVNAFEFTLSADENLAAAAMMVIFMIEDQKNISQGYNLQLRYTLLENVLTSLDAESLLEKMKKNNDRFYPYVLIFYMIYKMNMEKNNREYFYELKKLLIENKHLFGQSVNYMLWNILLTYCSTMGISAKEFNSIYEYILNNNIYKKSGAEDFHVILFRNIVTIITWEEKFDWLENFIEKYAPELHVDHRENMYNFSYGHLNFMKGNFEEALKYTSKINYDVFVFKIDTRILLLKIYFELSYLEQAYSLLDSTLHFLKNTTEFSESYKNSYRNFVQNFRDVLKLKSSGKFDLSSVGILEKKISDDRVFSMFNVWLLKKIDEMKVKFRISQT